MRIVYDHQIFSLQQYGGISRYFIELANRVANSKTAQVRVLSPLYFNAYLASRSPAVRLTGLKVPMIKFGERIYGSINQVLSDQLLKGFKPDLVHETYYAASPSTPQGYKRVLTVYDMIHELFPENFPVDDSTRKNKSATVARADHIICISEHTRQDLIKLLGVPREKTSVVHLGHALRTESVSADLPACRPYLLYVGERGGYKNFACLLRAYSANSWLMNNFDLLTFGGGQITEKEAKLIRQLGIPLGSLRQFHGDDNVLEGLYRRAAALIYPSLYEGFGIPPLEAMSFDCPVVCSNTSSMPEVVGNAAMLFNPDLAEDLSQALAAVLNDSGLRQGLIEKGRERIKNFSWEKCAQQTMAIYSKILAPKF